MSLAKIYVLQSGSLENILVSCLKASIKAVTKDFVRTASSDQKEKSPEKTFLLFGTFCPPTVKPRGSVSYVSQSIL